MSRTAQLDAWKALATATSAGLSKLPDVPSRVPGADYEQSLARYVKLSL